MLTEKEKLEICNDFVNDLCTKDKVNLWNVYTQDNDPDDYIFYNDEYTWNDMYAGKTPWEIMLDCRGNNINLHDEFLVFTIYGPKTFNYLDDRSSPIDLDDIFYNVSVDKLFDMFDEANIDYDELKDALDEDDEAAEE